MAGTGEYRIVYLSDLGYVVYRHSFDESRCTVEEGARAHKYAVFVEEIEARGYCEWRNSGTHCVYCQARLETVAFGKNPSRTALVCPKEYLIEHPRLVHVPKLS